MRAVRRITALLLAGAMLTSCNLRRDAAVPREIDPIAPAIGATDPEGPVQIVVWSSRQLPPRVLETAKRLPGVEAVGPRATGVLDLRSARGATRAVPRRPAGAVVPITVTALSAALLRAFPEFAAEAQVLERGEAIVPQTSASFRGVEVGDRLRLAGNGRSYEMRIGAIVEDGRIFRSEVVIPADVGNDLGLRTKRSIVLAVEPSAAADAERVLTRAIKGLPARIRSGNVAPPSTMTSTQLPLIELKKTFGEFWYRRTGSRGLAIDPAWRRRNIIDARVPLLGVVRCNRRIIPLLIGAMTEIEQLGLDALVDSYDGCYSPRMSTGNNESMSRHAYGVAVDINARTNGYGRTPTIDRRIVAVMERWGFGWGGHWRIPDGMHFEFVRFPE